MDSRYLILPILLTLLSSCSFGGTSTATDFSSMYEARVHTQVQGIRDFAKDFGYMESYAIDGSLMAWVALPGILSGSLMTDYSAHVDGKDAESVFRDVRAEYQMFMGSGSIQAKEFAFTSKAGDLFMKWTGLASTEMLDPESLSIIKKYENSWLSLTEEDMMASLSGASEDEIMANKLSQAMTKMTLSDVESYLTEYPIWKETKDLGMTGELHSYEVTLHKENMIAMAKAFVKKSTQKDMTPDALSSLEQSLAKIDVKGKISYDPKNPKVAEFDGLVVSREGTGTTVAVKSSENEKGFSLSVKAPSNTLVMNYMKEASANTLLFSLTEWATEVAHIDAKITKDGDTIKEVDATFSSPVQGLTLRLTHKNNPDRTFEGKIDGGVGNITWKGKTELLKGLTDLHITGAMAGSNLTIDLTPGADGMLRGPVLLKSGNAEVFRANAGLRLTGERFGIVLDIANPEDQKVSTHAEIDITGKRSPWSGEIKIPSPTTPLRTVTEELSKNTQSYDSDASGQDTPLTSSDSTGDNIYSTGSASQK